MGSQAWVSMVGKRRSSASRNTSLTKAFSVWVGHQSPTPSSTMIS